MSSKFISIISISQLKDNYCYLIKDDVSTIIIDPAESKSIIKYVNENNLKISAIFITHHHKDHTAGIESILKHSYVPVYSPNKNIKGTTSVVKKGDIINSKLFNFKVIETPGHTLDHIVYHDEANKILFSADVLFRLGCGRVFEGTYEQMQKSLMIINNLDNDTMVYCGHEYTISNLNFLLSIFPNNLDLIVEKEKINKQISETGSSIPFNLGKEKTLNPFLSSDSKFYNNFKKQKNLKNLEMFSYLRDLKNNF